MRPLHEPAAGGLPAQPWLPAGFSSIVGHEGAVAALRARVRARDHDTGIILYGPLGIGKRTLARLYARAVLCEAPADHGEACGACTQCQAFGAGRPFGYLEVDAAWQGDHETTRTLRDRLNEDSLAERKVVVIANADLYEASAFDILLKSLEEPKTPTTFILLATALTRVRLAGQSRCQHHRLRPLDPEAARGHVIANLASAGRDIDEQVIDVLVTLSAGRVGRMHLDLAEVRALPDVTLASVRAEFDLDWVQEVTDFWRAILSSNEPSKNSLLPPAAGDPRQTQRRIQAVLLKLRAPNDVSMSQGIDRNEAALLHRPEIFTELGAILDQRAATLGLSPATLWGRLARHWLGSDHRDAEGLRRAGQATRDLMASNA